VISVVIPSRNEQYLQRTIDDLLAKAEGEIEIITILDGYWPDPPLKKDDRVKIIHRSEPKGMRNAINSGAAIAKGEYLMKCDAHCCFDQGFDVKLAADCEPNWTVVPVRYGLDEKTWTPQLSKKYEFEYIASEDLKGRKWPEYATRVEGKALCELMTFQGSCWFMHRNFFLSIDGEDDINYGIMGREAQEICLKTWLSGGKCILDRNTWYAHWSKPSRISGTSEEKRKSVQFANGLWKSNKWDKQIHPLSWLINRFNPVPTWETDMDNEIISKGRLRVHKGLNRAGLYRMFAEKGYKAGAEVGVQRGRNAWVMLENIPDLKLYLIEPYKDHPANRRKWGEHRHEKFKKQAHERLKGRDVIWLEDFSEIAAYDVPDDSLDFVYIDGEHTWDYVIVDLVTWYRKVRTGGIISGHDFEYRGNWNLKHNAKVAEALMHFVKIYKIPEIHLTDKHAKEFAGDGAASWYFEKI
jgi:glycosyltransferase involved in cell wall biosynthesis